MGEIFYQYIILTKYATQNFYYKFQNVWEKIVRNNKISQAHINESLKVIIPLILSLNEKMFSDLKRKIDLLKSIIVKLKDDSEVHKRKSWITQKEIHRYITFVLWLTRQKDQKKSFHKMGDKFIFIWNTAGSNFLFKYLKEVMRLTVRRLANIELHKNPKIFVKLDKNQFPAIIGKDITNSILKSGRTNYILLTVAVLTVLSVFRVLPTKVKPEISTIIEPFTGIGESLSSELISKALKQLKIKRIGNLKLKLKGSLKAGPNSKVSLMGTCLDAMAFWYYPKHLFHLINFLIRVYGVQGILYSLWLIVIMLVTLPYLLSALLIGSKSLKLGRLSVVYDQAGKARIIAITNCWVQLALLPLHERIFQFLRRLETDGTFDQTKCFNRVLSKLGYRYNLNGFDLSAATDRLPISLQADILNNIGFPGNHWKSLISLPFSFKGEEVKYCVGQPMGAYSSFAMLALTHHVIVQIAAVNKEILSFSEYCVLGDDIVISNTEVSQEYLNLMEYLGLKISTQRSARTSKTKGNCGLCELSKFSPECEGELLELEWCCGDEELAIVKDVVKRGRVDDIMFFSPSLSYCL
uniref:RNA-dependent RNA polymerase n=1 Tax=Mitovirus cefi 1 TaxID=3030001 RepID=A0A9N6YK52_9VIRU|nr:TPA_asm: RNA-dependent RNA polymerase [Mitovirus cefi 1]